MIELDPNDDRELAFALYKAYKKSGLTLDQIRDQLKQQFGVKITSSAVSCSINRTGIRLQRALQILNICGETELRIRTPEPKFQTE